MKQRLTLIVLSTLLCLFSCKKQKDNTSLSNSWEFRELISSYPKGQISKAETIQIQFAKEIEGIEVGEEVPKKWFSISPNARGTWRLTDKSVISFEHEEFLKSDQIYSIKLKTEEIFKNQDLKKDFIFQVKTIRPDFSVIIDEIQSSQEVENEQIIYGHIETADIITKNLIADVVTAKQDNKKLDIEFLDANSEKYFDFIIKGIDRKERASEVRIAWNGKPINVNNKGSEIISLPGTDDFQVIRSAVQDEPNQLVEINFSSEIEKNQNLDGLLQIGDQTEDVKYSIDGNILRIYPAITLNGDFEVKITEGVKSVEGPTSDTFFNTLAFKGAKPELSLISNGTILPNSQGLKINFEATSLQAVDVRISKIYQSNTLQFLQVNHLSNQNEIRRVARPIVYKRMLLGESSVAGSKAYSLDLAPLIQTNPGEIYQIELSFKQEYSTYNCGEQNNNILEEETIYYDGKESYWDRESYSDSYWDYL